MLSMQDGRPEFITLRSARLELRRAGRGQRLVFLHPGMGLFGADQFVASLAHHFEVMVPSHPGFGLSELPEGMTTVDDLAYCYLDLLDALDLRDVVLVGSSLGGWIAAEIAVKSVDRIGCLVLIDPLGIKLGGREHRDIADIYGLPRDDLDRRTYRNLAAKPNIAALPDDQLKIVARNRESEALVGWSPYMHSPKLLGRLHRISKPALVLWGEHDGIVSPDYGRAFANALGDGTFKVIADAAHYPYIEQPKICVGDVCAFCDSKIANRVFA